MTKQKSRRFNQNLQQLLLDYGLYPTIGGVFLRFNH